MANHLPDSTSPRSAASRGGRFIRRGILVLILLVILGMLLNYWFNSSEDLRHVDLSNPSSPYPLRQFHGSVFMVSQIVESLFRSVVVSYSAPLYSCSIFP